VFVPKRRRKTLYGTIRKALGAIFHERARQKACRIVAGHWMPAHGHMCIEIPPKYAVASVIGFLKGKRAIAIARQFGGRERNFTGEHFWARGYAVSTVGFALEQVRASIRDQEGADEEGRFEHKGQRPYALSTTHVMTSTAFEAVLLIKPPALPGVSDFKFSRIKNIAIHNGVTHTQASVPQECFTACMSKRLYFLIHILIHISSNRLIQDRLLLDSRVVDLTMS